MTTSTSTASSRAPDKRGMLQYVRADVQASLVVFLVAMPLSLGIALASGAPMMSGMIAAAVGGIVVGAVGGVPLQVSGPAAGLTVMVYGLIQTWGLGVTCAITLCAGVLQMTFGLLRVARVALAISPAVIHGMLAGIGVLIVLSQIHVVLGGTPQTNAIKNLSELPGQIMDVHGPAALIGAITLVILLLCRHPKLRRVPGPLAGVVLATLIAEAIGHDMDRIKIDGSLFDAITLPTIPSDNWDGFIGAVIAITLVASAESLLCAVATDKMHSGPRGNLDRELFGQGLGNTMSGLLGGLPVTGVVVRSTANISAGAKTQLSAILHGVWIVLATVAFEPLLRRIPLAALAGLLVFVGSNLVRPHDIKELWHRKELSVYAATFLGVVFINLLAGIGIGVALAIARLLWGFSNVKIEIVDSADSVRVSLRGPLTFVGVPRISAALAGIQPGKQVELVVESDLLDHAAFEALEGFREAYARTGGSVRTSPRASVPPPPPPAAARDAAA